MDSVLRGDSLTACADACEVALRSERARGEIDLAMSNPRRPSMVIRRLAQTCVEAQFASFRSLLAVARHNSARRPFRSPSSTRESQNVGKTARRVVEMDANVLLADAFLFSTACACVYAGSRASVKVRRTCPASPYRPRTRL